MHGFSFVILIEFGSHLIIKLLICITVTMNKIQVLNIGHHFIFLYKYYTVEIYSQSAIYKQQFLDFFIFLVLWLMLTFLVTLQLLSQLSTEKLLDFRNKSILLTLQWKIWNYLKNSKERSKILWCIHKVILITKKNLICFLTWFLPV